MVLIRCRYAIFYIEKNEDHQWVTVMGKSKIISRKVQIMPCEFVTILIFEKSLQPFNSTRRMKPCEIKIDDIIIVFTGSIRYSAYRRMTAVYVTIHHLPGHITQAIFTTATQTRAYFTIGVIWDMIKQIQTFNFRPVYRIVCGYSGGEDVW